MLILRLLFRGEKDGAVFDGFRGRWDGVSGLRFWDLGGRVLWWGMCVCMYVCMSGWMDGWVV